MHNRHTIYISLFLVATITITVGATASFALHHNKSRIPNDTATIDTPMVTNIISPPFTDSSPAHPPLESPLPTITPPISKTSHRSVPSPKPLPSTDIRRINNQAACSALSAVGILNATNAYRRKNGLGDVHRSKHLEEAMQRSAEFTYNQGFINHGSPEGPGTSLTYFSRLAQYNGTPLGENQLSGACSDQDAVQMWINSPGHRANLLNPQAKEIGVGTLHATSPKGSIATGTNIASLALGQ